MCTTAAAALELYDVTMPDKISQEGRELVLNGMGDRTYFMTSVYVAGLYLTELSQDENAVLNLVSESKEPVLVRMQFKRSVSESDMRDAWRVFLEKNSGGKWSEMKGRADAYLKLIPAVKPGDILTHAFPPGKMTVLLNQKPLGTLADPGLSRVVLATWIGSNPTTEKMKLGLLRKKS